MCGDVRAETITKDTADQLTRCKRRWKKVSVPNSKFLSSFEDLLLSSALAWKASTQYRNRVRNVQEVLHLDHQLGPRTSLERG